MTYFKDGHVAIFNDDSNVLQNQHLGQNFKDGQRVPLGDHAPPGHLYPPCPACGHADWDATTSGERLCIVCNEREDP